MIFRVNPRLCTQVTLTDHEQGVLANMCDCVAANAPPAAPPAVIGAGARAPHPGLGLTNPRPGLARLRLASASSASSLGGSSGLHGGVHGCSGDSLYDLGFEQAIGHRPRVGGGRVQPRGRR